MSINYSSVVLIGVDYDDLTYSSLTDHAKILLMEDFKDTEEYESIQKEYLNEDCEWAEDVTDIIHDALYDYFNDNLYDLLDGWFEVSIIGNCFTGRFESIGIGVELKVNGDYSEEINTFKKYINLEPTLLSGVYVW